MKSLLETLHGMCEQMISRIPIKSQKTKIMVEF